MSLRRMSSLVFALSLLVGLHGASARDLHGAVVERSLAQCETRTFPALQPVITHSPVVDLQWIDKNDLTVFGITKKSGVDAGGLWLSKDGGKAWSEKTGELSNLISAAEPVDILAILSQKSNPANIVLIGSGTYMWASNDYGKTFVPKQNPNLWKGSSIVSMRMHPYHDDHLLMMVKRPNCKKLDHAQQDCPLDLVMSKDLFASLSWANLTANSDKVAGFVDFDWAANLCPRGREGCKVQNFDDDAIFATLFVHAGDYDEAWDPDVHFVKSNDMFKNYDIVVHCGNMFELLAGGVYLAFANNCKYGVDGSNNNPEAKAFPNGISLYVSTDASKSFIKACLPAAVKQEGYELMETHDGTGAIVIVDFEISTMMMDLPSSSVFTAGPHEALFSLSMNDLNHANFGYSMDFSKVEGMPGVYIANQMASRPSDSVDEAYTYDYYSTMDFLGTPLVQTQISYNGGGKWTKLAAPSTFNYPKCNRCEGNAACYLHLNGMSSWDASSTVIPSVYSNPSAPGMIMGIGNVGLSGVGLGDNDGMCTWLSVDGGMTWKDVAPGPMIYEFADWGSTIVMAPYAGTFSKPAEELSFSTDFGVCWKTVPLTTAILVDNIRIEPDGQRPRVIVHGRACRQPASSKCSYREDDTNTLVEGIMYTMDVAELMTGALGLCSSSDYEWFNVPRSPTDSTPKCILGKNQRVQRRRQASNCLYGPDYNRATSNITCACSAEADLECDYGYIKTGTGVAGKTQCTKLPENDMPACPELNKGVYTVSKSGYRIVHADVCSGSDKLINDTDGRGTKNNDWWHDHPEEGGGNTNQPKTRGAVFHFFMFVLVTVILAGAFLGWWRFLATEAHRDTVRDLAAGVASFFASLFYWVVDKVKGRSDTNNMDHDLGYFQPLGEVPEHEAGVFTIK